MANTISTVLHHYRFDTSNPEQAAAYAELKTNTLQKLGFPVWTIDARFKAYCAEEKAQDAFMDAVRKADGQTIDLDCAHLFANQWNAKDPGLRLFNWGEMIYKNRHIKRGYWLEQTPEMAEVLRNTHNCGYCGAQEPAAKGYTFCPHCLGSEYLTREDLHLTRMRPVGDTGDRAPLTDAEAAHLLPIYKEAQLHGRTARDKARIAKQRADIAKDLGRATRKAQTEHDGKLWLLDNGLKIDNVIYYEHKNVWCFGWRTKVDPDFLSAILDVISEFPFSYEILCADGRTLAGHNG